MEGEKNVMDGQRDNGDSALQKKQQKINDK